MSSKTKYAQVLFDYDAIYGDELSIKSHEVLQILYNIDNDWVYAKSLMHNNGAPSGMVPINYLSIIDIPEYLLWELDDKYELFLGISDFLQVEIRDLAFKKGQLIVCQKIIDSDWMEGFYFNDMSKTGIFPKVCVVKIYLKSSQNENSNLNKPITGQNSSSKYVNEYSSHQLDYTYKNQNREPFEVYKSLKQAKVLYAFSRESDNEQTRYLKLNEGDYILVTGNLDENWIIGEDIKGEKGIYPANYIEYIEDKKEDLETFPILNRTQRRYTFGNTETTDFNIKENIYENSQFTNDLTNSSSLDNHKSMHEENQREIFPNKDEASVFYCRINYDFAPENETELGCLTGEYLKITRKIKETDEWVDCENYYGRKGLVPKNFLTILNENDQSGKSLFEKQNRDSKKRLSDPIQDIVSEDLIKYTQSKLRNQSLSVIDNADLSKALKNNIDFKKSHEATIPINSESKNTFRVANTFLKPEIPPKPKLVLNNKNIFQNLNTQDKVLTTISDKPRPKFVNKDFQENIKKLEKIIGNQANKSITKIEKINYAFEEESNQSGHFLNDNKEPNTESTRNLLPINHESKLIDLTDQSNQNNSSVVLRTLYKSLEEPPITNESNNQKEDKRIKKKNERIQVIHELIVTEKEYNSELDLCYKAFMQNDIDNKLIPPDFNNKALFDKLKSIIQFSKSLISKFDAELELNDQNVDSIKIGEIITGVIEEMRIVYAQYTRNHNDVADQVKKYQTNQSINAYILSRLDEIKNKVKVSDLATILIKPVQRIFKYPLFINRLIENTESNHHDFLKLKEAAKLLTAMLEFINEYKRRKDLVSKYLTSDPSDASWSEKMKKLNMRTLKKKSNRITYQISNALGFYDPKVIDENFLKEESMFRRTEKFIKSYQTDINSYLKSLKDLLETEKDIFNVILFLVDDSFTTFSKFENTSHSIQSIQFREYHKKIVQGVLSPLNGLISLFNGPNKLIDKRFHKLMDYESALSLQAEYKANGSVGLGHTFKEIENQVEMTKKDYEALNFQLLEEMSEFNFKSKQIVVSTFKLFSLLTAQLLNYINTHYKENIKITKLNLEDDFFQIPFAETISSLENKFNRQSLFISSNHENVQPIIQNNFALQTEDQRKALLKKYKKDDLFVVTRKYIANTKLCQLNQNINDLVGLIKPYDPANQHHIWCVDNGVSNGFIPCEALTPYNEIFQEKNLIDLGNSDAQLETSKSNSSFVQYQIGKSSFNGSNFDDHEYCIALYNFKAITGNMINLTEGEIYKVIEKCDKKGDPEWWLVEYEQTIGYVPKNYVKPLE